MATPHELPPPPSRSRLPARRVADGEGEQESTAALVRHAVTDVTQLLRAELNLAKHEWRQDARELAKAVPAGVAGGMLAAVGTVFVLIALVLALALALDGWAAFLIGGAIILVLAAGCFLWARSYIARWNGFVPERTLDTLAENRRWIRQQLS